GAPIAAATAKSVAASDGVEAALDLALELRAQVAVGIVAQRAAPLEARLLRATDAPIGVAQVVEQYRIQRQKLDRALEQAHRVGIAPGAIHDPGEAIDDLRRVRPLLDRARQHALGLLEAGLLVVVNPRISEIVEHIGLVGLELERAAEIRLRLLPLLRALVADAALVVERPLPR